MLDSRRVLVVTDPGFHTHKAVTYRAPIVLWLFMIGRSVGRMETCFGWDRWDRWDPAPKVLGSDTPNTCDLSRTNIR